jgi:hypothetical protein
MKQLAAIIFIIFLSFCTKAQEKQVEKKQKENKPTTMLIPKLDTTYLKRNNFVSDSLSAINKASLDSLYTYNLLRSEAVQSTTGTVAFMDMGMSPKNMLLYAFCNLGVKGAIIKITNPSNHKFVYAKILAAIPVNKNYLQSLVLLSHHAQRILGTNDEKLFCEIIVP